MKLKLLNIIWVLVCLSCVCGMCSKGDDTTNNSNNTNDTVLKSTDTWVYFDDCPSLVYFYQNNKRPQFKKWIATKFNPAFAGFNTGNGTHFLSWFFENTGDSRFLSDVLNPGGKEYLEIFVNKIPNTPGIGSYTLDIDWKQGFCWYKVQTYSDALHDSTRVQGLSSSSFNITKLDFFQAMGSNADRYKMSGNATFNIMYWKNGTGSTTDIHTLNCTFNNVFIDFMK